MPPVTGTPVPGRYSRQLPRSGSQNPYTLPAQGTRPESLLRRSQQLRRFVVGFINKRY